MARAASAPSALWAWRVADGLSLAVRDDVGTRYRSVGRSATGILGEWRLERHFEPSAPREATTITVAVDVADGRWQSLELTLPDSRGGAPGQRSSD